MDFPALRRWGSPFKISNRNDRKKMKKKIIMSVVVLLVVFVGFISCAILPRLGSLPKGKHLEEISLSPNYDGRKFQNINPTPMRTESIWKMFSQPSHGKQKPKGAIPAVNTDLFALDPQEDLLIWFGHSSCFLQLKEKRFLIDPVFSAYASPVSFANRAFEGTDTYKSEDIPDIDYLIITHDHWDHLDYNTVRELRSQTGKVICPLGVSGHFVRWGYDASDIIEMDWNDTATLDASIEIHCLPARHSSGRGLRHKKTLWASFLLKGGTQTVFVSGDSGYDTHFAEIGKRLGPIDFALLENGQYNTSWKYIHMQPEETLQAGIDLRTRLIIPMHNSKFSMSSHKWDEPLRRITAGNDTLANPQRLLTPRIGEIVLLKDTTQSFSRWWEEVE